MNFNDLIDRKITIQLRPEDLKEVIDALVDERFAEKDREKNTMTIEELAEYLGVTVAKARRICRENPSLGVKAGKCWLISRQNVDEAVQFGELNL